MPLEIERKYLVIDDAWRAAVRSSQRYLQGYLQRSRLGSVRVRRFCDQATVTVKGPRKGITRQEFEYPVPVEHAEEMRTGFALHIRVPFEHGGTTVREWR